MLIESWIFSFKKNTTSWKAEFTTVEIGKLEIAMEQGMNAKFSKSTTKI
jgi:hypothetical protein